VPPYVDYLDGAGAWVGGGNGPPASARYVRRWAVIPLPEDPDDSLVLQVIVLPVRNARERRSAAAADVRLVSVKTRRAS